MLKYDYNSNPAVLIDWFDYFGGKDEPTNEYRFLSNFYVGAPLLAFNREWQTGEHMFAALKANSLIEFDLVQRASTPSKAKALGRRINLRSDWEQIKYDAMRYVLSVKFTHDREEGEWLLSTGDAMLVEGTDWDDKVWGIARQKDMTGEGRNWLGILLMARRAELRAEALTATLTEGPKTLFDYEATRQFLIPSRRR